MEQHGRFKVGERVAVLNQRMDGTFVVEGYAEVVTMLSETQQRYVVAFENDHYDEDVERYLSFDAQDDPQAYVDSMNARIREAKQS